MSENIEIVFEINSEFVNHLHDFVGINGKSYEPVEHLKNALELYAKVLESMSDGKVPVMVDSKSNLAEKIELPLILALLKQDIDIKENRYIDLIKKQTD